MLHNNILWVEDFDTTDGVAMFNPDEEIDENLARHIPDFFSKHYVSRVSVHKYVLETLEHLEEHFMDYDCVVLDINLHEGFGYKQYVEKEELQRVEEILKKYRVCRKMNASNDSSDAKRTPCTDKEFEENAGYYLYLYLLQRGFPSSRIVMLTGNAGDDNLSGNWDRAFGQAGIISPKTCDKKECELSPNDSEGKKSPLIQWLDQQFTPYHELRSCIVAMSSCVIDLLDEGKANELLTGKHCWTSNDGYENYSLLSVETCKSLLDNMKTMPLIEPAEPEKFYLHLIGRLTHEWEAARFDKFREGYAYWTTLRTTRNWIAHSKLAQLSLLSTAFLFGIGMRGLFNFSVMPKCEAITAYLSWEDQLLSLMKRQDEKIAVTPIDDRLLLTNSCRGFYYRARKILNDGFEPNMGQLIYKIGKEKSQQLVWETDLLRDFLHAWNPSKFNVNQAENSFLGFKLAPYEKYMKDETRETQYIKSVIRSIGQAVEQEIKEYNKY